MMSKDRARLIILNDLLAFPTINQKDWRAVFLSSDSVAVGDLVSINAAPVTKWYLSWVREIKEEHGLKRYLLESVEDGGLCWWSNIGMNVYTRANERPTWQWDDKQFAFNDRWRKVCKRNDAYIVIPCQPEFEENNSVGLNVRIRYALSDFSCPRIFPNWRKVTMKEMEAYYRECCEAYKQETK